MRGDFSRLTFKPENNYLRVLMQQGRVHLDADWNEQIDILLHYMQTLAADIIGPYAGPVDHWGYEIIVNDNDIDAHIDALQEEGTIQTQLIRDRSRARLRVRLRDLLKKAKPTMIVGKGRYYVDGLLCENHDYYAMSIEAAADKGEFDLGKKDHLVYLVYLDAWERHITYQEEEGIREVALEGVDTATRTKVISQVKILDMKSKNTSKENTKMALEELRREHWGFMRARAVPIMDAELADPYETTPNSHYEGIENQLYRIEIHDGGCIKKNLKADSNKPTFNWSKDNGSIAAKVKGSGNRLTVTEIAGYGVQRFGKWIELTNEARELGGKSGEMIQLRSVDGNDLIMNCEFKDLPEDLKISKDLKVRGWDQKDSSGAISIIESDELNENWIKLEDGIEIQFQPEGNYITGDYWVIPARVVSNNIEWPSDPDRNNEPMFQQCRSGIDHHFAPLAFLTACPGKLVRTDLRCKFDYRHLLDEEGD
jgi:hypothetical protein